MDPCNQETLGLPTAQALREQGPTSDMNVERGIHPVRGGPQDVLEVQMENGTNMVKAPEKPQKIAEVSEQKEDVPVHASELPGAEENNEKKRKVESICYQPGASTDGDVSMLLNSEPPVIRRREQLNSEFRSGLPDEAEERELDEGDHDEENEPEMTRGKPAGKAKAKAKSRPKGKAKAKAKAKAKGRPSPKGKAKAKAAAKRKAKAKASPQASNAVDTSGAVAAEGVGEADVKKKDGAAEGVGEADVKKKDGKVKTFARRYPPPDVLGQARHAAIQQAFESGVAHKVMRQSSLQARVLNPSCFEAVGTWSG